MARAAMYRETATTIDSLATEAEARPADLADWVAAATRSRLGEPMRTWMVEATTIGFTWRGPDGLGRLVTLHLPIDGDEEVRMLLTRGNVSSPQTPKALLDALNALADAEREAAERQGGLGL